jgi:hypothetical protein
VLHENNAGRVLELVIIAKRRPEVERRALKEFGCRSFRLDPAALMIGHHFSISAL